MKAIGLDHPTRELAGLCHTTTATDIMRGTGRETGAESNTITTRITIETATSTITTDMVIMTTAGTIDSKAWKTHTAPAEAHSSAAPQNT